MSALRAIDNRHYGDKGLNLLTVISFALLFVAFVCEVTMAEDQLVVPIRPVAQMTFDDDGFQLNYPFTVFFDDVEEEIYLVNGGSSRVVVYGPDYYPRVSIGVGRGILAPRGIFVTGNGEVFITQAVNRYNPINRISILNGAFFIDREIILDDIPEAAGFSPKNLTVSRDGTIYVTSDAVRGVLVLDKGGNFLRWLKPEDLIKNRKALAALAKQESDAGQDSQSGGEAGTAADQGVSVQPNILENINDLPEGYYDIPEEYRPRDDFDIPSEGIGPVKVAFVTIDSAGRLYLLSNETGRVYVYSHDETFLFAFGEKGGTPRHLSTPRSMAIDEESGLIYVVDYMRHSILAYDMAGEYLFEFGGRGWAPGWFNFPNSIAFNRRGEVIIADLFNKRVQVLDVEHEGLFPTFKGEPDVPEQADVAEEDYDSQDDLASPDEEVDSETPLDDAATDQAVESGAPPDNPGEDLSDGQGAGGGKLVAPAPVEGQPPQDDEIIEEVLPELDIPQYPEDRTEPQ